MAEAIPLNSSARPHAERHRKHHWNAQMTTRPASLAKILLLLRRAIIIVLAGLLIFYHSLTLYEMYLGAGKSAGSAFDHVQSVFRALITMSLLLVVFGLRRALWGMWLSIAGLVATQYWAHFGDLPVDFTEGRHPLSYLKGFIFPTVITLAFPPPKRPAALAAKERDTRHGS